MPHAIQIRQTGRPEVPNWTAVDVGEPGLGQVRLRQAAAGLNYIDVYHRTGYYPQPLLFIPGLEGAGTVEAVAQDVQGPEVGDRVAYAGPTGGYSEVRLIEADRGKSILDEWLPQSWPPKLREMKKQGVWITQAFRQPGLATIPRRNA